MSRQVRKLNSGAYDLIYPHDCLVLFFHPFHLFLVSHSFHQLTMHTHLQKKKKNRIS